MKMSTLSSQSCLLNCPTKYLPHSNPNSLLIPISQQKHSPPPPAAAAHLSILSSLPSKPTNKILPPTKSKLLDRGKSSIIQHDEQVISNSGKSSSSTTSRSRFLIVGAVSVGVAVMLMGMDEQHKAMALGPEGPLMEEFWDNVRRYGLYALTVSTGALYATFLPIYELLKNPISAILVLAILGGGIFIFSQVLSAMVGVSDFTYEYGS